MILKEGYFLALVLALMVAVVLVFAPFLSVIIAAFILVEAFYPVYSRLAGRINPWFASIITTILALITVVFPLIIILILASAEAIAFVGKVEIILTESGLVNNGIIDLSRFSDVLKAINVDAAEINIADLILQATQLIGQFVTDIVGKFFSEVMNVLFKGFLMIFTMIYLFVDHGKIGENIRKISPLQDNLEKTFAEKFRATTKAVLVGTFVIALLQSTAVLIPMFFMRLEPLVLWWILMFVLSIIPVGSGLVWFPLGILLILSGRTVEGIFLIIYSAVIINVIDTSFRPRLIKKGTNLHPIVALFSVLGGLNMFGVIGILYGPLIAVFFITVMEIYRKRYRTN